MDPTPSGPCPSEETVDEYALHHLPPEQAAIFERHLRACARCARELRSTRRMIRLLREATAR